MARQLIIDNHGKWWLWPSKVLESRFNYPDPDFDLWSYAVRNLGYIALVLEEGSIFVQYRPGLSKEPATRSLLSFLEGRAGQCPVFMLYYLGGWTEEYRLDGRTAAERIREIGAAAGGDGQRQPFLSADKNFDALFDQDRHHRLAQVADLWRAVEGKFDKSIPVHLAGIGFLDRTIISTLADHSSLIVQHCGLGYGHYDGSTYRRLIGQRVENQPDRSYGEWVATTYRAVITTQLPQFADIDAIIRHPERDLRRSRYQRLILPWKKRNGQVILTSTSLLNPDINIPLSL